MNILETLRREGLDGKFFTLVQDGDKYKVIDIKRPRPQPVQTWHTGPRPAHWAKPGQRAKPITQEQRDQMERMYLAGVNYKQIRDTLKMNYVKMQDVLRELEAKYPDKAAKLRNGGWTDEEVNQLLNYRKLGHSHREISRLMGRTENAIETKIRNIKRERK